MVLRHFLAALAVVVGCQGNSESSAQFMPENDLYKYDTLDNVMTEADFNELLAEVHALYQPIVAAHHAELIFVNDWFSSTVNAAAAQDGPRWYVYSYGGLARRIEISSNKDGLQLVACHEIGHHVGSFPFYPSNSWRASTEGQSDYFAAQSCARELWRGDEKNAASAKLVHPIPKKACDEAWKDTADRHLCYRISLASKSLADLLSAGKARYEEKDRGQVSRTNPNHPQGQCRLDTYLAATICPKAFDPTKIPATEKEQTPVLCQEKTDKAGFRPRCWFKPGI